MSADEYEWVEWNGGGIPPFISGLRCDVKFRNGTVFENQNYQDWWHNFTWCNRAKSENDIVSYRRVA